MPDNSPHFVPLASTTDSEPSSILKKTRTNLDGVFAQIIEIEVDKKKEIFIEKWNAERRISRISVGKIVESIASDHSITGNLKLSPDATFAVFAAELKPETKKSFFDEVSEKDENVTFGQKFVASQNWGEQMTKTKRKDFRLLSYEITLGLDNGIG